MDSRRIILSGLLATLFAFSAHAATPLIDCHANAGSIPQTYANPPQYTCTQGVATSITNTFTASQIFNSGIVTPTVTSSGTSFVASQTGDTFGATSFSLENRVGLNGFLVNNATLDLVDMGALASSSAQANMRFEHRSGQLVNASNTNGEWQEFLAVTGSGGGSVAAYFGLAESGIAESFKVTGEQIIGNPTGGYEGSGTLNAASGIYDGGDRVYSALNYPPFANLTGTAAQGDILYYTGSAWAVLAPSTSGYFLQTQGASANPVWAAVAAGGDTITSPNSTLSVGGTSTNTTLDLNLAHSNAWTAAQSIASTSANALAVGLGGTSNPAFNVDASASSAATGLDVQSLAAGSGVNLAVTSSASNDGFIFTPKGTGNNNIGAVYSLTNNVANVEYLNNNGHAPAYVTIAFGNYINGVNAYYNGSGWVYATNGEVAQFQATNNGSAQLEFQTAGAGTAGGSVSFTQQATITKTGMEIGFPTGGTLGVGDLNAVGLYQNGTQDFNTPGTGLSASGATVNSNAQQGYTFTPGVLTAITSTPFGFQKVVKASTVDNITVSSLSLTCATNPTIALYECGTSTTCASPTTIGSVQVTAAGTATPATVSSSAITAGDYIAASVTAGTCTSSDITLTAQIHSN